MEKIKTLYEKTEELVGKEVVVEGWVKTVRDSKTFGFMRNGLYFKVFVSSLPAASTTKQMFLCDKYFIISQ